MWPVMQAFSEWRVPGLAKIVMVQGDMNGRGRRASPHFAPLVVRPLLPYLSFNI